MTDKWQMIWWQSNTASQRCRHFVVDLFGQKYLQLKLPPIIQCPISYQKCCPCYPKTALENSHFSLLKTKKKGLE